MCHYRLFHMRCLLGHLCCLSSPTVPLSPILQEVYLTLESTTLYRSPQRKRGSHRQSRLAIALPRFPHTHHLLSLRLSPSLLGPMDRQRRLHYLTRHLVKVPRRMRSRTSSRSFITISPSSRQNFWLIRANRKTRAVLSSRVVHRPEPMMWRRRDGRKRSRITSSEFTFFPA
jgi:hypothetical protein